jgi:hypothetical protein
MGGTLTRDEWLKLREGNDNPRGVGNIVIPLAHQMTTEERLGQPSSAKDASPPQSDQSKISLNLEASR